MTQVKKPNSFFTDKLSSRDKLSLIKKLEDNYGDNLESLKEYNFYINNNSKKVFISKITLGDFEITRFSGIGIYFGTFHDNNRFRLSLEGSKFINSKKNFIKINFNILKSYIAKENLFEDEVDEINIDKENKSAFYIVIYDNENLGCVSFKKGIFLNYIPKSRKLDYNKLF